MGGGAIVIMRDEFGVFCKGIFYIYAVWGYRGEGEVNSNLQYELLSMGTYAVNRIGDIKSMFYSRAADATMTTTDSYLLYTLPAQYRPKFTFETVSFIRPGVHAVIRVGIDGTVTLSKLSSQVIAGLYVFFHITFI